MSDIKVTQSAIDKISQRRKEKGDDRLMLRVLVKAGGCSGFEYVFDLDTQKDSAEDLVFNDVVVIDKTSAELLKGAEIDFVDELIGSDFKINNPNAVSGCGCGASFAITGMN